MSAYKINKQLEIAKKIERLKEKVEKGNCREKATDISIKSIENPLKKELLENKEKSFISRHTEDFEVGSRFLNGIDDKEYILSRGIYENKRIWSLVCLETGLTWNGFRTSKDKILKGTVFTKIIK